MFNKRVLSSILVLGLSVASCGGSSAIGQSAPSGRSVAARSATRQSTGSGSTTSVSSSTSSTAVSKTQVVTYQPFIGNQIDSELDITGSYMATSCYRYGGGAAGRYYFRCFAKSGVYDPCFPMAGKTFDGIEGLSSTLICPRNPTDKKVVELHFARSSTINADSNPWTSKRPWAFELANGTVCKFLNAAWSGLGPYDCYGATPTTVSADCRVPQMTTPLWTTTCQDKQTSSSPFTSTVLVKAWM